MCESLCLSLWAPHPLSLFLSLPLSESLSLSFFLSLGVFNLLIKNKKYWYELIIGRPGVNTIDSCKRIGVLQF